MKKFINDSRYSNAPFKIPVKKNNTKPPQPNISKPKKTNTTNTTNTTNNITKPKEKETIKETEPEIRTYYVKKPDITHNNKHLLASATTNNFTANTAPRVLPSGYSPAQLRTAYNFPVYPALATPTTQRAIIAIIDAYGYSGSAYNDLQTYCNTFGIPYPANGGTLINATKMPTNTPNKPYFFEWKPTKNINNNSGWTTEMALDIQTAWGLTQQAGAGTATNGPHIILFHASSASTSALLTALNAAVSIGASVISMSFGAGSYISSFETTFFNCASTNKNIVFVASSGDYNTPNYPSTSTYVLSAGGTTLQLKQDNTRNIESYWYDQSGNTIVDGSGTGRMPMTLATNPTFTAFSNVYTHAGNVLSAGSTSKNTPDICAVASPSTGFAVYQSGSWYVVGGTSLSAPLIASFLIIINQIRLNSSKAQLTQLQVMTCLYSAATQSNIYQINNTTNGTPIINGITDTYITTNGISYDLDSGLGALSNNLATQFENL